VLFFVTIMRLMVSRGMMNSMVDRGMVNNSMVGRGMVNKRFED